MFCYHQIACLSGYVQYFNINFVIIINLEISEDIQHILPQFLLKVYKFNKL